ncbi:unnamed protein product [Paramecium sonneborni]|uniref:Uncharacterized protein n=1 Tax=Paramecium sonneborni TaxID=65129 RepID=A0A8S1LL42_9CILI|nr:unnamed protein product [Paramecium sonneborni]
MKIHSIKIILHESLQQRIRIKQTFQYKWILHHIYMQKDSYINNIIKKLNKQQMIIYLNNIQFCQLIQINQKSIYQFLIQFIQQRQIPYQTQNKNKKYEDIKMVKNLTLQEYKNNQQELTPQLIQESEVMSQNLAQLLEMTQLYANQQSSVDISQFGLFQALYRTILKGSKVYLIGLSQIYQRIYIGIIMQLPDVKNMIKEFCEYSLQSKYNNLNYFFEYSTMIWIEKAIEYYMLYSINRFLKRKEENEVTFIVDSLHFDPLKSAIQQQNNKFVNECENSYFYEFQYPDPENKKQMSRYLINMQFFIVYWIIRFGENLVQTILSHIYQLIIMR